MSTPKGGAVCICSRFGRFLQFHWTGLVVIFAPLALARLLFRQPILEYRCAYVLSLMFVLWITEALPVYVTSLLPIVLFPLLGILDSERVCRAYFSNSLVLFFGCMMVAMAIVSSRLHKRIALFLLPFEGCGPRKLQLCLMLVTMLVSLCLYSSAVTCMMFAILKALLSEMGNENMLQLIKPNFSNEPYTENHRPKPTKLVISHYLGIAYAATIGGCATLIGSGANMSFKSIYDARFPNSTDLNFVSFTAFSFPTMLLTLVLVFIYLQWLHFGLCRSNSPEAKPLPDGVKHMNVVGRVLKKCLLETGVRTCEQMQVGVLFVLMLAVLVTPHLRWFDGAPFYVPSNFIKDSFGVITIAVLLFMLPNKYDFIKDVFSAKRPTAEPQPTPGLLTWRFLNANYHWGQLLLIGSGLVLAEGISASGYAVMLAKSFSSMDVVPPQLLQLACICIALLLTPFTSSIAICNIMQPILMEISIAARVHPLYLTLPTCLAINMGFVFRSSTTPNSLAVVWANIQCKDMFIGGLGPTLISLLVIFGSSQTLAFLVIPNYGSFPSWALQPGGNVTGFE